MRPEYIAAWLLSCGASFPCRNLLGNLEGCKIREGMEGQEVITEYQLIESLHCGELECQVNDAMKNGWKPYGPPFVRGYDLCQAMVKTDNDKQLKFDFMKEAPHA